MYGCQSDATITAALDGGRLSIVLLNYYIDFNDYENPIKMYFDDRYTYRIVMGNTKFVRLYVRENHVNRMDSLIDLGFEEKNDKFLSVEKYDLDLDIQNEYNSLINIAFVVDPNVDYYNRKVYTVLDMTGQIGGLYEVLGTAFGAVVSFFASRLFVLNMMNKIYLIRTNGDKQNSNYPKIKSKGKKVFSETVLSQMNGDNLKDDDKPPESSHKIVYKQNTSISSSDLQINEELKLPDVEKRPEFHPYYSQNTLRSYDNNKDMIKSLREGMLNTRKFNYTFTDIIGSMMTCCDCKTVNHKWYNSI